MMTTSAIAVEPFCMATLPGWLQWQGDQGVYGRRIQTHGDHLHAELHLRRFSPQIYSVVPITGNGGVYWLRPGDSPPSLRDYRTGQPVQEDKRGETLSYYVAAFSKMLPTERLVALSSFGDAGVNENRGLLTPQALLWVPHGICKLAEPHPWLVCWKTGVMTIDWLCVEGEVRNNHPLPIPLSCWRGGSGDNLLPRIKWALAALPVIKDGRPTEEVVWQLDDDLRHWFNTPRSENGLYIMESALLKARGEGWCPSAPLEVDLSLYGDTTKTIATFVKAGYQQVYATPRRPGEFQIIAKDRILCWPQEVGYAVSIFGLCRDGSLGSFVARAQPTDRGYFGPSVSAQIRMVAPFFSDAFIVDEGLDCTFYDLNLPPEEFLVRGRAGGRLSAVLCFYEKM